MNVCTGMLRLRGCTLAEGESRKMPARTGIAHKAGRSASARLGKPRCCSYVDRACWVCPSAGSAHSCCSWPSGWVWLARPRRLPPWRHRCKARKRGSAPALFAPAATATCNTAGWLRVACLAPARPLPLSQRKARDWSGRRPPYSRHLPTWSSRVLRRPPIPVRRGFFSTRDDDRARLSFGASEIIEG